MEIFADTSDITEITTWLRRGVLDGVTTNPSIMLRDGVRDIEKAVREIAHALDGRPVSVEVTTSDHEDMLAEARAFAAWAPNIVAKIPIITEEGAPCLEVIHELSREGITVNATAILSFNQVMLAAKAGAAYMSIFAGRVADEGHDPVRLIRLAVQWVERWRYGKILAASIRGNLDVQRAAAAGAHVITIPPAILERVLDHKYSRDTVREFNAAARLERGRESGLTRKDDHRHEPLPRRPA